MDEVKESASKAGDPGSIPGSGRSPGEGNGNPLQYSCLKIPRTEEPSGLQFMGSIPWRRKWKPTPVLLPENSKDKRSLVGYSSWGRKESDTTERPHFHFQDNGATEVAKI